MRDFNKHRYLIAFIITCAIFFIGFFFGFLMDIKRADYFESMNEVHKLNIRSLQLQYELTKDDDFIENKCSITRVLFDKFINELEQNRERLELYSQQSKINKDDFDLLKREYVLSQINFLYMSQKLKNSCQKESDFVTVIYFYSDEKNCPMCEDQAAILNYYKTQLKENFLVFALDEQFDSSESTILLLKQSFGVTEYPTVIVNSKEKYSFMSKEELKEKLCEEYSTETNREIINC